MKFLDYNPENEANALRILANLDANGGTDGLPVQWARAVMRRLGYSDLWDHDIAHDERAVSCWEDRL